MVGVEQVSSGFIGDAVVRRLDFLENSLRTFLESSLRTVAESGVTNGRWP